MVAITVKENNVNTLLNDCFGKSKYFFIYDKNKKESEFISNPCINENKLSGKKAAMFLINYGVTSIISMNFGTEVKKIFDKYKIQMIIPSSKIKTLKDIEWIQN